MCRPSIMSSRTPRTSRTVEMSSIFEGLLDAFKLNRFQPNLKHNSIRACGVHLKHHQGHQLQSGTSKSSSAPAKNLQMSSIFEGILDAFKLIRYHPIFNKAPSGHMQTIHNVIKDTSPSQEHQYHHQLQ